MKPEQVSNCVRIEKTLIPAVNINVDDMPGYIEHDDGTEAWYGVYFEVLFEDGTLWVVGQGDKQDEDGEPFPEIYLEQCPNWDKQQNIWFVVAMNGWDEFLDLYKQKVQRLIKI